MAENPQHDAKKRCYDSTCHWGIDKCQRKKYSYEKLIKWTEIWNQKAWGTNINPQHELEQNIKIKEADRRKKERTQSKWREKCNAIADFEKFFGKHSRINQKNWTRIKGGARFHECYWIKYHETSHIDKKTIWEAYRPKKWAYNNWEDCKQSLETNS